MEGSPWEPFFSQLKGKKVMKHLKIIIVFLIVSLTSFSAFSYDHTLVTQTTFNVVSPLVESKFEDTVLNPEGFLKRFNPVGVQITKKVIRGNEFEYVLVKRILGIPKSFHLLGSINFERSEANCPANQKGYLAHIDLTPSGPSVTNTIADFTLLFCGTLMNSNQVSIKSTNSLFYHGDKFGSLLENFARSLIVEQVEALTASIKAEVVSK